MMQVTEVAETTQTTKISSKEDFYNLIFNCQSRDEKKELLKQFSQAAKMRIEAEETQSDKINDVLIEMYSNDTHQEFSTFKGWKEKGFKVKKGSKGFFIWSKPLKGNKNKEQAEPKTKDEKDTFKFFGVAYIFSNAQVEPLKS